jgi:hypothetical protein
MNQKPESMLNGALLASVMIVVSLGGYVSAYFARTATWGTVLSTGGRCRVYPSAVESLIFIPAAKIESTATGQETTTAWR